MILILIFNINIARGLQPLSPAVDATRIDALERAIFTFTVAGHGWGGPGETCYLALAVVRTVEGTVAQTWSNNPEIQDHLWPMLANSPDALGVSLNGVHVFVNPTYVRLFGYSSESEILGRPILDLIAPSEHARIAGFVRHVAERSLTEQHYETVGLRKDGTEFPMETHVRWYKLGDRLHTNVVLRDVSQRHAAERALEESRESFRIVAEQFQAGVLIRQDGRLVYVNEGAARMLGVSVVELLAWTDETFGQRILAEDLPTAVEFLGRIARGENAPHQSVTYRFHTPRGPTWVEHYSRAILFHDRPAYLSTFVSVHERKLAEERHMLVEAALHQAQKMDAIGRLAGGVAHDFNNLLTGILGNVQLALGDLPPDHPVRALLADAEKASQKAANLTKDLLAFSRRQAIQPRVVDLNEVVLRMDRMVGRLLSEEIERDTHLCAGLLPVKVDPAQLEQVVMNLVLNARDAMPTGGKLHLHTRDIRVEESQLADLPDLKAGRYARLTVEDTGVGIGPEVKNHLFEPFFTTKERGRGTGLGLATSFGAVRQNDGTIVVDSEPGRGTAFHVYLPLVDQLPQPLAEPPPVRTERHGTETILLVEDEPAVLQLVERVMLRRGYRVLACNGGPEALAAAGAFPGTIHLLLTDVVMPGMTGPQVATAVRARRPDLKVLFMSGYAEDVAAKRGVVDVGTHFLSKPFTLAELAGKVRDVLDLPVRE
jgi:PAS domain S-box-containing protein